MEATYATQYCMPSSFDSFRGYCPDAENTGVMPVGHAVIACLFIIFCVVAVSLSLPVIVVGLLVLLTGLVRLLIRMAEQPQEHEATM